MQLQNDIASIRESGLQVVGISYDSVAVLKTFTDKEQISFPLLSDPDSKVISAYGVLNDEASGRQEGVPHPGTFVVGQDGRVKAFLEGTVRRRHTTAELIEATQRLAD